MADNARSSFNPGLEMNILSYSYSEEANETEYACCTQCRDVLQKLYMDNQTLVQNIQYTQQVNSEIDSLYKISAIGLALRRLPALVVTLILEMCGGIIINQLHEVIQSITLIVSFMPAISALSGNLGLQASANTIRGLGTGAITPKNYKSNILKEIKSGLISASIVAIVISSIAMIWAYVDAPAESIKTELMFSEERLMPNRSVNFMQDISVRIAEIQSKLQDYEDLNTTEINSSLPTSSVNTSRIAEKQALIQQSTPQQSKGNGRLAGVHPFIFGGVIFIGTWISMMVSTVNGASTPILANVFRVDPAKVAGPLETAFQDIVGQSFLLGLSYLAFHYIEHFV